MQWNWNTAGSEYCKLPKNIRTRNNLRHCLYMWTCDQVFSKESDINLWSSENIYFRWKQINICFPTLQPNDGSRSCSCCLL